MPQNLENPEILLCRCHSAEHQILVHYDEEDNMMYLHIHLTERSFWHRLKYGLKYIFGSHCRYGQWNEFIFNENDADKLQAMADALKTVKQKI
jgi:hypothetical protein